MSYVNRCHKHCFHIEFSDEVVERIREVNTRLRATPGKTNAYNNNQDRDIIGGVAQDALREWFLSSPYQPDEYPEYMDEIRPTGDGGIDFIYNGESFDVKTHSITNFDLKPWSKLVVDYAQHKPGKMSDWYVMTKVDLPAKLLHVCGVIKSADFWQIGLVGEEIDGQDPIPQKYTGFGDRTKCFVRYPQTISFRQFVFGVV